MCAALTPQQRCLVAGSDWSHLYECGTSGLGGSPCAFACLQAAHPLDHEVTGTVEGEDLGLRSEHVYASRTWSLAEEILPAFDSQEDERDKLRSSELPATRVYPDHGLFLLCAEEDHVVVRGHHHLVGPLGMSQDHVVARTPWRCLVVFVSDMTCVDSEHPERRGDTPRQQLVEQQPDVRSTSRGSGSPTRRPWLPEAVAAAQLRTSALLRSG